MAGYQKSSFLIKLLPLSVLFWGGPISQAFPCDASDYSGLALCVNGRQTPINILATPINWTANLSVRAYTIFNNLTGVPITFSGGSSKFMDIQNTSNMNTMWNGDFIFSNSSTTGAGAALYFAANGIQNNSIFEGDVTFQNNSINGPALELVGIALEIVGSATGVPLITFNKSATFTNNTAQAFNVGGVALGLTTKANAIFNQSSFFTGNTATLTSSSAAQYLYGAAVGLYNSIVTFNESALFSNNSVTNNFATGATGSPYGGAVGLMQVSSATLVNPQFTGNQAIAPSGLAFGGAIGLSNSTMTIRATDPNTPVLFQGNTVTDSTGTRQEAIYLGNVGITTRFTKGPSTLTLIADPGAAIRILDGVNSDGTAGNSIIKQGAGIWQQGGNSSNYKDTTTIQAGSWVLLPGSVYGNTSAGTVTVMESGVIIFDLAPGAFPLLQAQTMALNGGAGVEGVASVLSSIVPGESFTQAVALSGTTVQTSSGAAEAGLVLAHGQTALYDWDLVFASPTELDVRIQTHILPFPFPIDPNADDAEIEAAIEAAAAEYMEVNAQSLTGGYFAIQNQVHTFSTQLDQRLKSRSGSASSDRSRVLLAFGENRLPFQYAVETPWAVWAQGMGGRGHLSHSGEYDGYKSDYWGLSAGADRVMEKWRFGFGINGGYSKLDWKADDAKTKADGLALAFYGSYDEGPWYMHWQLGGGRTWVDNHRHPPAVSGEGLMSMTTKSNSHVNFYNGRVATGYNFERGKTTVTPVVGIAYVHSFNNGYQEKSGGIFDLIAEPNAQDNLEAQVGVEGLYTTHIGTRQVGLRANVGLGYELMDKVVTLQAGFADFPILGLFDIQSQNVGRVRGVLGAGVDVLVAKNARLSLEYMGDLKRHQYNNLGAISLKVVF